MTVAQSSSRGWRETLALYRQPQAVTMLLLGFSSGLPLMLVFGTLSFWLREAGIERSTIGFVSWVALAYAFKWVWAPLVDRLPLPLLGKRLGRRRSWMLLSQLSIIAALIGMATTDPTTHLTTMVLFAVAVAFSSATQDITIDAYRIESADTELQGTLAATYMVGYRLALVLAGAGALAIAESVTIKGEGYQLLPWTLSYLSMAAAMGIGVATTLLISEPAQPPTEGTGDDVGGGRGPVSAATRWFYSAVIRPFSEFFLRYRWHALLLLLLIGTYRISDIVLGVMSNVFFVDLGFSKGEVATISKFFGVVMTLLGALLGGLLVALSGVMRVLFLGALLSSLTNLLYAWLATVGHSTLWLALVISADNLSAGIATAAFVAYLSSLTNISYSATQYALFSSIMLLLPKFIGGFSGVLVDDIGYQNFFILTAIIGLPVLALVAAAMRWTPLTDHQQHRGKS